MALPTQIPVGHGYVLALQPPLPPKAAPITSVLELEVRTRALSTWADIVSAGTQPDTDTTLASAATRGGTSLTVADLGSYYNGSTAGAGHWFLLADGLYSGDPVLVQADRVDYATGVITLPDSSPCPRDFASGARVYAWTVMATLSAAQVGDYPGPVDVRGELRTSAADEIPFWTVARTVYRVVAPPLHPGNVQAYAPQARHLQRGTDIDLSEALAVAWEQAMARLEARDVDPWAVKDPARLADVHATALYRLFGDASTTISPEFRAELQRQHREALDLAILNPNLWIDLTAEGSDEGTRDEVPRLAARTTHLTRRVD